MKLDLIIEKITPMARVEKGKDVKLLDLVKEQKE
jgi:hypothetical protein